MDTNFYAESVMDGYSKFIVVAILLMCPSIGALAGASEDIRHADELYAAGAFEESAILLGRAIDSGELSGETLAKIYFKRGLAYGRYFKNAEALSDYELAIIFESDPISLDTELA